MGVSSVAQIPAALTQSKDRGLVLWGRASHLWLHIQVSAWAQAQGYVQRCELDLPVRRMD